MSGLGFGTQVSFRKLSRERFEGNEEPDQSVAFVSIEPPGQVNQPDSGAVI
jgi:hypothetical protein